jgi:hypothetical protein
MKQQEFFVAGKPRKSDQLRPVRFPYDDEVIAEVYQADAARTPADARRVGDPSPAPRMTGFSRGEARTSPVTGPSLRFELASRADRPGTEDSEQEIRNADTDESRDRIGP